MAEVGAINKVWLEGARGKIHIELSVVNGQLTVIKLEELGGGKCRVEVIVSDGRKEKK